jgi:hypothetical protein
VAEKSALQAAESSGERRALGGWPPAQPAAERRANTPRRGVNDRKQYGID